jgi:addiction module RelE/StbE family toxin
MKILWSPTAISDLESIRSYIARDSPAAAGRMAKRIKESVNHLSSFPFIGRAGRVAETRELVIAATSYIVAYTIQGNEVRIAAVLHGKQRWPEGF